MIELHFVGKTKQYMDLLNYVINESLAGSPAFQKGDEIFCTPVEKTGDGKTYAFILYVGAQDTEAPDTTVIVDKVQVERLDENKGFGKLLIKF